MSDACSGACSNAFRQNTIPGQLARRVKSSNAAAKNESKMKAFPVLVANRVPRFETSRFNF